MEIIGKSIITDDSDKIELSVELKASAKEVNKCEKEFFKELSQNKVDGFRKGRAPKQVLEQMVGGHQKACDYIAERIFNEYAIKAIDEDDIIFLELPEFNMDGELKLDTPLNFTVTGLIAPEIEVENVDPIEIEMPPDEATDKEIEDYILDLRDAYHTFEDIKSKTHKVSEGDYVSLKMTVTQQNGTAIKGLD
ncbi:MAG: hypothetical protein MJ189_04090, partial [Coriobacteriales bacterium]|nr:hypothetical protein [Coriobacteriales bacterium]